MLTYESIKAKLFKWRCVKLNCVKARCFSWKSYCNAFFSLYTNGLTEQVGRSNKNANDSLMFSCHKNFDFDLDVWQEKSKIGKLE